jgi:pimeloyl-ACP methyl ester carboxylesterase
MRPPDRTDGELLPDGRWLGWYEWGPSGGRPVLWCPGAATSGRLGFGFGAVDALGLRLIGLNRPGLADSSPHPAKTLESWCEDVAHVVAARRWQEPPAVGFSQGAVFALALGGAGLVDEVAVIAGQDDLAHLAELLPDEIRSFVAAAGADPDGFVEQVTREMTPDTFLAMVGSMNGPRDRAVYESAQFAAAFAEAVHDAFRQGAAGYARDLVNALRPWPVPPEQVRVPVTLWYGEQDRSPMHSPDHGRTLSRRLPRAELVLLPDEGGSLPWTRGDEILRRLVHR